MMENNSTEEFRRFVKHQVSIAYFSGIAIGLFIGAGGVIFLMSAFGRL